MEPIARVVIADDHEMVRKGLADLFAGLDGVEVAASAEDGLEAIALCRKLRPALLSGALFFAFGPQLAASCEYVSAPRCADRARKAGALKHVRKGFNRLPIRTLIG